MLSIYTNVGVWFCPPGHMAQVGLVPRPFIHRKDLGTKLGPMRSLGELTADRVQVACF